MLPGSSPDSSDPSAAVVFALDKFISEFCCSFFLCFFFFFFFFFPHFFFSLLCLNRGQQTIGCCGQGH